MNIDEAQSRIADLIDEAHEKLSSEDFEKFLDWINIVLADFDY